MTGIHFEIDGTNEGLIRKLRESRQAIIDSGRTAEQQGNKINQSFEGATKGASGLNSMLLKIGGTAALTKLVSDVIRVRGEFQQLDVAFTTLLQSKEKANALMAQMVETAAKTPFNLTELATGARQLVAYGFASEEVNGTLVRLGNVAAGLGLPLERLTYLYGTTMTQGRLYTRDLMQFTTSGIPMLQGLADMYGVSTAKINEMVTAGKIGFPEVQKVIENMTNEGGKFFNLMEEQSKTITGKISNLGDAMDTMFNSIGQANEGVINDSIDGLKYLVENYEQVGRILLGLVTTYGTYKVAVMLAAATSKGYTVAQLAQYGALLLVEKAQKALNLAVLKNPYVIAAVALVSIVSAMWAFRDSTTAAEKAQNDFNASKEEAIKREEAHKSHIEKLISTIQDETAAEMNRIGAMEQLKAAYPHIFAKYIDEKGHLRDIIGYKKEIEEFDAKVSVGVSKRQADRAKQELIKVNKEINYRQGSTSGLSKHFRDKTTSELREMQSELLKSYQLKQSDYDKLAELEAKAKGKLDSTTVTQDKAYWEKQKKEARTELDALTDIEASGKEGSKLKEKIAGYDKKINAFSVNTSKQESTAAKLRQQQEKSSEELLSLRRQNQQEEINLMKEGAEKKLKQIELDYQKELDTIKKQEKEWSKNQGGKLTQEQSIEISSRYTNADNKKDKGIADTTKEQLHAEQQVLNEYLEKYGTFQQQKLAIAQEYAEKIKKAQEESGINSSQVKLLQRERDDKSSAIDAASIKANIDWATVFGEFGGMFTDMIKPTLEEAKKYAKTDQFKNSDQASQKSLIDAINQMEKSLGGAGGVNFKKLGQEVQVYQTSLNALTDAKREEIEAINKLKKVQEDYEKAIKSGTETEKQATKDTLDNAQQNADAASTNVKTQTGIVNENQQDLSDTATNLRANMDNVTAGLSKLASGGIKNAYDGIIQAGKGMGGAIENVSDKLEDVPIVGWIVSIIDVFKDGLSNLVGGILDAVFNAISGIISDVLSGDIFVTIGKSLRDGIGNIFNAISFGGWDSLMDSINGSDAKEVNELVDKLTTSNKYLIAAIDKLTEEMEKSGGAKATTLYTKAYEKEELRIENDRQMLEAKMGYNSAHHSNNYYIDWSEEISDRASQLVGKNLSNLGDVWKLSAEDFAKLQQDTEVWEKLHGGKYDWSEYIDQYVEDAGKLEELTKSWQETMTQTSFDSFYGGFLDTLMDMDSDAQDFADDFEEYLKKSILNAMLADNFKDRIQKLYENWTNAYKNDDKITEDEAEALRNEQQQITDEMLAKREELMKTFGWESDSDPTREASKKGIATASQDSVDENNGRLTVIQGHTYSINEKLTEITNFGRVIMSNCAHLPRLEDIGNNLRALTASQDVVIGHLSNIEKNTARLEAIENTMVSMNRGIQDMNTKGLTLKR